jgi:predicted permease
MTIILTSLLPICLIATLGAFLSRRKFVPPEFFTHLNRLGFFVLLPALLYHKIATADTQALAPAMRIGLLLSLCAVLTVLLAALWSRSMRLPAPARRALMQASMRGNLAYSGLPILIFVFGAESQAATLAVISLVPVVPFFNFLAVIVLTPPEGASLSQRLAKTARNVMRNPLITGCLLGLASMLTGLTLPGPVMRAVEALGDAALSCALLSLGAELSFRSIRAQLRPAGAATVLKLLTMPLLGYLILAATGTTERAVVLTALIYLAAPTAVSSYVMAEQMGADKELAAAAVTLSTLCAIPVFAAILLQNVCEAREGEAPAEPPEANGWRSSCFFRFRSVSGSLSESGSMSTD